MKASQRYSPRKQALAGQYTEARDAWVDTGEGDFILYVHDKPEPGLEERWDGISEAMVHVDYKGRRVRVRLDALTESELDALEEFWKYTIERVRPFVQARDQKAQEAAEHGDYSHIRIYRPAGRFIVRPRSEREHGEGVQERSEDDAPVGGSDGDPA